MRPLAAWLLGAALLLLGNSAQADLQLRLKTEGLSPEQQHASQVLLDEAMQALPPRFIEQLDRRIDVGWTDDMPHNAYGQASLVDELDLNRKLLAGLTDGSAATQKTHRPHGTVRREMLATVLHELTHIYDRSRLWSGAERTLIQRCSRQNSASGLIGLPDQCRGQTARRFTLSDDPRLLDLAGWPQYVGRRGEREQYNRQVARSPDIYETTNPKEFVAVNMEYFLLDPSYACRRPALYRYYQEHFGWAPKAKDTCTQSFAFLNAGNDFAKQPLGKVDPERVYAVDYLLAEANQNWVSRWGHSMLRLVICAPGRPRGPDCRLDLEQHLVLSYRAFVGDVQLSSWDGLVGKYPSRLFILPLAQVIDEYTKTELRSLASVPLNLSRNEIEEVVERAAEMHWSYDGNYYFLSNNCAVESLKLLRSGSNNAQLTGLDSIMPNGLLEVLKGRGLADTSVLDDPREALRLGYRFDSFRDRYQAMFEVLKKHLPIKQNSVEDWLSLSAAERRQWFGQADLRTSAALLLLEQASFRRQLLLAQDEVKQRYLGARDLQNGGMDKANKTLQEILANSGFLSRPAELLGSSGYGLPQPSEWQRLESESSLRQKQLQALTGDLDKEVRALLEPNRAAEIAANEANLKQLGEHLRALHRAAGGLELP
ncbi:DUF7844 domain-containing protein [Pseudomonas chlororaphis]|uniref:DUF7844 domain-containing protein n=1 Tax=Pseudomonas chlororaphis TaxID=587753 RepID=UPI0007B35FD2|nr:DUF4105 domain-containing protein [Pseudomonas chlororaphis]AZC60638.1 hypothetical protein C4K33_0108 [Pseudomonas chlororaphis subsp. piscium]AZC66808.1 hypothetical protein C4K32_0108 [Pseudomonas chlororaphis subsp. piscium]AZC86447.1 hypothetical protein C4K29_0107 [Pseudomonas chlororaphis subsp. piscium]KZO46545.1 hypothetical protein PCL1391_6003 [Pseudomonas chlororaphis subsp. piscium]MBP5068751.1 DUF4105 domain-containing protein [Pseudomonas chlororaphis]